MPRELNYVKTAWRKDREKLGPYWITTRRACLDPSIHVYTWWGYVYENILREAQKEGQLEIVGMSFKLYEYPFPQK